jgi:hypothetical protein
MLQAKCAARYMGHVSRGIYNPRRTGIASTALLGRLRQCRRRWRRRRRNTAGWICVAGAFGFCVTHVAHKSSGLARQFLAKVCKDQQSSWPIVFDRACFSSVTMVITLVFSVALHLHLSHSKAFMVASAASVHLYGLVRTTFGLAQHGAAVKHFELRKSTCRGAI